MLSSQDFDKMPLFTGKDFDRYRADIHRVYRWGLLAVLCGGIGVCWLGGAMVSWWMR